VTGPANPVPEDRPVDDAVAYAGTAPVVGEDAVPYDASGAPRTVDPRRPVSRHGRSRHPWRLAAVAVIAVGVLVLVGGYFWVRSQADPSGPQGAQVIVTVPVGSGENAVGSLLASKGVISSSFAFRIWSQFNSLPGIRSGLYAFRMNSSFGQAQSVPRHRRDRTCSLARLSKLRPGDFQLDQTLAQTAVDLGEQLRVVGHAAANLHRLCGSLLGRNVENNACRTGAVLQDCP